jgi:hypothetical protein
MCKRLCLIQLTIGATLILMGLLVLSEVGHAQAEEIQIDISSQSPSLSPSFLCLACPSQNTPTFTQSSADPCKACHMGAKQIRYLMTREEQIALELELKTLQARILSYGNQANAFQKQDDRYQTALENLWDAQSAQRLGSVEQAYALIAQANQHLGDLENEDASGFWTSSPQHQTSYAVMASLLTSPTPVIHLGYVIMLTTDLEPCSLDKHLILNIPLRRILAIHRRGPPAFHLHIPFEMNRRLSNTGSPFYFRVLADMRGFQSRKHTSFNVREKTVCGNTIGLHRGLCAIPTHSIFAFGSWVAGQRRIAALPLSVICTEERF